MKEVYHCSPVELERVPEWELNLHFAFLMAEREHEYIEHKRSEQKAKQKNKADNEIHHTGTDNQTTEYR